LITVSLAIRGSTARPAAQAPQQVVQGPILKADTQSLAAAAADHPLGGAALQASQRHRLHHEAAVAIGHTTDGPAALIG
jgi:hypothetical protein